MKITKEDIEFIRAAKEIIDRGNYPSGTKLKEVYQRVLADEIEKGTYKKNLSEKCGSCLRQMGNILYNELEKLNEQIIKGENKEEKENGSDKEDSGENKGTEDLS